MLIREGADVPHYLGYTLDEFIAKDSGEYFARVFKKEGRIRVARVTSDVFHKIEEHHKKFIPQIYELTDGIYTDEYIYDEFNDRSEEIVREIYELSDKLIKRLKVCKCKDAKKAIKLLKSIRGRYDSDDGDESLINNLKWKKIINYLNNQCNKDRWLWE